MNRPHKYRGRTKGSEWLYGDLFHVGELAFIVDDGYFDEMSCLWGYGEVDPATVGEFTGQRDKNGKEIWEGHKVFWKWSNEHTRIEGIIKWSEKRLAWTITNTYFANNRDVLLCNHLSGLEVIGNIHDKEAQCEDCGDPPDEYEVIEGKKLCHSCADAWRFVQNMKATAPKKEAHNG